MKEYVAIIKVPDAVYPSDAPYHPSQLYPEYPFGKDYLSGKPNHAYEGVREAFHLYGLDEEHFNTPHWNPLGEIIHPGDKVVIKPNFVLSSHEETGSLECVVTHPSVLRAIADYSFIALKGKGLLIIADSPMGDCDFQELSAWGQFDVIKEFYADYGLKLDIIDLRKLLFLRRGSNYQSGSSYVRSKDREYQDGDPLGYTVVDLGHLSLLDSLSGIERFYGADYDRSETIKHHSKGYHEYLIARSILTADVVINVPKMKTHKKVGATLNIKNLVGINGDKNYLPHYRIGSPSEGGDEFPDTMDVKGRKVLAFRIWLQGHLLTKDSRIAEFVYHSIYCLYRNLRDGFRVRVEKPIVAGNWYANDTCWRMAVDLMGILFFADIDGKLQSIPQRRFFSVVDGIIGGEKNGPLAPSPVPSGVVAVGDHPFAVDIAVTRLMGFSWRKIPQLAFVQLGENVNVLGDYFRLPSVEELRILSKEPDIKTMMRHTKCVNVPFQPHPGWVGHVEL